MWSEGNNLESAMMSRRFLIASALLINFSVWGAAGFAVWWWGFA